MEKKYLLSIDGLLYKKFKGTAAFNGLSVKEALQEAIERWVEENEQACCNNLPRIFERDCRIFKDAIKKTGRYKRNATRAYMETRRRNIKLWSEDRFLEIAKTLIDRGQVIMKTGRSGCIYYILNEGGGPK